MTHCVCLSITTIRCMHALPMTRSVLWFVWATSSCSVVAATRFRRGSADDARSARFSDVRRPPYRVWLFASPLVVKVLGSPGPSGGEHGQGSSIQDSCKHVVPVLSTSMSYMSTACPCPCLHVATCRCLSARAWIDRSFYSCSCSGLLL